MKLAIATEDGKTVSQHFGRAPYYAVLTIEDGKIVGQEQREKPAHQHGPAGHHEPGEHTGTGIGGGQTGGHGPMIDPIRDCQVLVAGGMGSPAYQSLQTAGIRPIITEVRDLNEAARQFAGGTLVDHPERMHR